MIEEVEERRLGPMQVVDEHRHDLLDVEGIALRGSGDPSADALLERAQQLLDDPAGVGFAQRLVTVTDWFFTFWGIVLLVVGGFAAAWMAGMDPLRDDWLVWSEVQFILAGMIWLFLLVPIQVRQAALQSTNREPLAVWWFLKRSSSASGSNPRVVA